MEDQQSTESQPKGSKMAAVLRKLGVKGTLILLVVLLSLGAALYFYMEAENAKQLSPDAVQTRNLEDSERIINKVNEVLVTESTARPTVARVEDPAILIEANPDFYKNTQAGDYLILYPSRAIIYRESENLIVNVAPIVNTNQLTPSADDATEIETGESDNDSN